MTARNLKSLLYPKSISITGATSNPEDLGSYILKNIIFSNYKGAVYPVNANVSQLYDFDTYSSLKDIKEKVDLAILSTPFDRVIDDVYDCTRSKVKSICIASRGFVEAGPNGLILQKKIVRMANEAGIRVLGPNSLGVISTSKDLNATFGPSMPNPGKAVFMSQSGALINALLEFADFYKLGFSEILGLGNKSDVSEVDLLDFYTGLRRGDEPMVIGSYLENIANGKEFLEVAQKCSKTIPVVTLIPSESPKTKEYIYSHSGSVIQNDEVIDLALAQSGVIKAFTQQQLYDAMLAFSWQVLPRGSNVAVISNAGGGLILAIEQIYRAGLNMVNFSTEVKKMLLEELDWKNHQKGVVDLGGEALSLSYLKGLDIILGDHDVNAVLVVLSPQLMTQIEQTAEVIGKLTREHKKPVIAAFMGYERVEEGMKALAKYFIPAFNSVDRAVYVLSKMYEYAKWKERGGEAQTKFAYQKPIEKEKSVKILEMIESTRVDKRIELAQDECFSVLNHYDIETDNVKKVKTLKDVLAFGKKNKYPIEYFCMKNRKGQIAYSHEQMREVFERHFEEYKLSKQHKFSDHIVKKIYANKKNFWVVINKDSYYEHLDKGFSVHDLNKLSFGHLFEMKVEGGTKDDVIKVILPFSRNRIEDEIIKAEFVEKCGYIKGSSYERFKEELITLIQKVVKIPLNFPQIQSLSLNCVSDRGFTVIVNNRIKLDLLM